MTITYTAEVATCSFYGCFLKLLARWRGSIYKLVWMDLIAFLSLYYLILCIYIFGLNADQQRIFEKVVDYCDVHISLIPLSFMLGFYVAIVVKRWWEQYLYIPWPDSIAVFVSAHVQGKDDRARLIRRTVMRYVCLCQAIVLSMMSPYIKKRFPTWDNFVTAGLLQESEKRIIQKLDKKFPLYPKHWMPIIWSASIIQRARKEGRIQDDCAVKTIVDELNKFRARCGMLLYYDFISIPLVYTQTVTLAVYGYFIASLMGRQPVGSTPRSYFPLFTLLEFFFYMGWLKVAESLINPFGDDDDDFEVNWMVDRHLLVSYLIVDEMHQQYPELVRDQYWDEVFPSELPYANEDAKREEPPVPSTAHIGLSKAPSLTDLNQASPRASQLKSATAIDTMSISNSVASLKWFGNKKIGVVLPFSRTASVIDNISTRNIDSEDSFHRLSMQRAKQRLSRRRLSFLRTVEYLMDGNVRTTLLSLVSENTSLTEDEVDEHHEAEQVPSHVEEIISNESLEENFVSLSFINASANEDANEEDARPVPEQ